MAKGKCHVLTCACYERGRADENEACAANAEEALIDAKGKEVGVWIAQRIRRRLIDVSPS